MGLWFIHRSCIGLRIIQYFYDAMADRECDDTSKLEDLDKREVEVNFDELVPIVIECYNT